MATWQLDPDIVHLNHGSFGATPVEVLAVQNRWRDAMEANPVSFMLETYQPALNESRRKVAEFVNADSGGVVFVPNATYGVNSVLRSLEPGLEPGDEVLVTNHGYNACNNTVAVTAARTGAKMVVVDIPFRVDSAGSIAGAILDRVTGRTRLVVVDHVTSPTALIMPVDEIVSALEPGVPVLVDGAHAPGMVPVDLGALGASFYTANCHKWMCAPKGSGFLYVSEAYRETVHAVAVSHGYNDGWPGTDSRFHAQFDWTGTDDPTARLSVGTAIEVMAEHRSDGWEGIRRSNHEMVVRGRAQIAAAVGATLPVPESMIGSIASVPIPPSGSQALDIFDPLMTALRHKWSIEVPVFSWPDESNRLLRISAQQYNSDEDYERLAEALRSEL